MDNGTVTWDPWISDEKPIFLSAGCKRSSLQRTVAEHGSCFICLQKESTWILSSNMTPIKSTLSSSLIAFTEKADNCVAKFNSLVRTRD